MTKHLNILFFFILSVVSNQILENCNILQYDIKHYACFAQNTFDSFSGASLFKNTSGDIYSIAITGWAFLNNFGQIANAIVQIKEQNNQILDFTYYSKTEFFTQFFGQNYQDYPFNVKPNTWYYFIIFLQKTNLSGIYQYNLQIQVFYSNDGININQYPIAQQMTSTIFQFDKQKLLINIGGSDYFSQCCCYLQYVYLFWNLQITDLNIFGILNDPSSGYYLPMYFLDFFGSSYDSSYIFNQGFYQDKIELTYHNQDPSILFSNQYFIFDTFSSQTNGFIFSFYFRMLETPNLKNQIMKIKSYSQYVQLNVYSNNQVTIEQLGTVDILQTILQNQWVQVIFAFQLKLNAQIFILLQSSTSNTTFNCQNYDVQYLTYFTIQFGDNIAHNKFQIAYVDIFEGALLSQSLECKYQIHLIDSIKCLQCNQNYLLDIQNSYTCVPSENQSSSVIGVKDQMNPRVYCSGNFIEDKILKQCLCRRQYFLKNGICHRCPIYCDGGTFDDGFSCLLVGNYYVIPSSTNTVYPVSNLNFDSGCSQAVSNQGFIYDINNSNFILNENDSFFYGFTMLQNNPSQPNSVISYFKNNGQIAFSVRYSKSNEWEIESIIQLAIDMHWTLQHSFVTIFLWVIFDSKATIILKLKPPISYQQDNQQLFNLIKPFNQILQYYIFDDTDPTNLIQAIDQISQTYLLTYKAGIQQNNNFKGFAFSQKFIGQVQISFLHFVSFSCSIYIDVNQKRVVFQNIGLFFILLVPHESLQSSFLQICYAPNKIKTCLTTQKCMIQFQSVSYLLIIHRLKCQYCTDINSQEFTVVVNYCQETLTFHQQLNYIVQTQLNFGVIQNDDVYFLNQLKYYQENGFFYFSYDLADKCFIYINLSQMKCIYPKQNYYFLGNQIIKQQECIEMSYKGNQVYYINEYSRECIQTKFSSRVCAQIDLETNQCLKCKDSLRSKETFCLSCIDGYFLDQSNQCKPCHFKCTKCKDSYDNCLICKYLNSQDPPSCDCFPSQYLNSNLQCTYCSNKCLNCQDSPDLCTQCNFRRAIPPDCNCDGKFYQQNQNCDDIICDKQCQTCQYLPSQCLLCKYGRDNPPQCSCFTNYYPTSN
ncbi:hypothetical protein ABPG72_015196 [Tetrahymena utriculariae]